MKKGDYVKIKPLKKISLEFRGRVGKILDVEETHVFTNQKNQMFITGIIDCWIYKTELEKATEAEYVVDRL